MPSVFITGASTGIGRDATLRMAGRGWMTFAGVRSEADASDLESTSSGTIRAIRCDVTDIDEIESARDEICSHTGGSLTGLVNNAGIAIPGPIELVSIEDLRKQFEVNVIGAAAVTKAFIPALRSEGGRIVNISSVSGFFSPPLLGPYSMSKHALESMSDTLRRELASSNIKVSIIEAARIQTPIWEKTLNERSGMLDSMTDEDRRLYGKGLDGMVKAGKKPGGDPVSKVSDAVEHALVDRKPKVRYRIGTEAKVLSVVTRLAPDRLLDKVDPFA
jgi:NAD(P)-dependent dehydrogenase (short-subunit alcohol dehydrogenase family)